MTYLLAALYIVALILGSAVRRIRYPMFALAAGVAVVELAIDIALEEWLAAGVWTLNLVLLLVVFSWWVSRRTDRPRSSMRGE